ncbi:MULTISPECIES: hypothetical protein [unclassified Variovorax]|uniref:hypothetical protein n=1 Tax=unclassified Variovorax TaxID=663243 RepID=UPI003F44E4F7
MTYQRNETPEPLASEPIKVSILPTKIWIENTIFGQRIVVVQHEGMPSFDYCIFNYRYGYTDNASTWAAAQDMARSLGAVDPIEVRYRQLDPQPKGTS